MNTESRQAHKLTILQRIMYGMGNMGGNFLGLAFQMYIMKLYCPGDGQNLIPPLWMGAALFAGRVVDAVADPLIGFWSDNTNTRWGRRIPFLIFGGFPMCFVFFLLWVPPPFLMGAGPVPLFAYLCLLMGAFWILFTAVLCPYLALLPEICESTEERLDLASYQSTFMLVSSGIVMGAAPVLVDKAGYFWMGLVFAIMALVAVTMPVFAVKEKYVARDKEDSYTVITALKWSFQNRPFLIYVISSFFQQVGFQTIIAGMPFIVTVLLMKSDSYTAIIMGGAGAVAVLTFLLLNKFADRFDKKEVYKYGMLAMALLLPLIYFIGRFNVGFAFMLSGHLIAISELHISFFIFTMTGVPIATLMVMPPPILSDIIDIDELKTGQRREAMYFGAQGLLQKSGAGLSALILGVLFQYFGNSSDNHLGIDLMGPVTAVFVFIGFVIFMWYPVDQKQSDEIREQIAARKASGGKQS